MTLEQIWSEAGTRLITAFVVDDDGAMASTNTTLTIVNLRPTAVISSASNLSNLVEGDWLNLTAADSLDTESDLISLTYVWDTDALPGAIDSTLPILQLEALAPGTYSVNLTVTDDDGASHSMNVQLVVAEAPTNNPIAWAVKEFGMTTTIIIGVLGVVILGLVSMLVLGRRGGAEELVETKSSSVWDQAPVAATFDAAPAAPLPAPTPALVFRLDGRWNSGPSTAKSGLRPTPQPFKPQRTLRHSQRLRQTWTTSLTAWICEGSSWADFGSSSACPTPLRVSGQRPLPCQWCSLLHRPRPQRRPRQPVNLQRLRTSSTWASIGRAHLRFRTVPFLSLIHI